MNLATSQNLENFQDEFEENNDKNIVLDENTNFISPTKSIEKESIYVLNNDPISFFNLIIELNKKYHVKQLSKVEQLFLIETKDKNPKIIIDISKLKNEDKQDLGKLSTANLILFYEDYINEDLENKALKVYQKPLSHDVLFSL